MKFLIQENLFSDIHDRKLLDILTKYDLEYHLVKSNEESLLPFKDSESFCFGSVKLARIAKEYNLKPGSFFNENHDYLVYSEKYGKENMLNGDSLITTIKQFEFPKNESLFIRPTKDSKIFTGKVFNMYDWEEMIASNTRLEDNTIQVSKPKDIQQEVRNFIVNGKVITSSYYRLGSNVYHQECKDDSIIEYAQSMANIYNVADGYVMDIAMIGNEYKIVEINCLNSAGFYDINMEKLIESILDLKYIL